MAGRLSEEDLQQFHALLNSDVFYKKRFKELSKEYAKYLIPHFAEEEANNFTPPEWFGEDVTFSGKYHNSQLSKLP